MANEELIIKLSVLEQRANQIEQQLQIIEENVIELENLKLGLDELKDSKGKEIFANVGRGIFIQSKIESDGFLVDVGDRNFVKKDAEGIKKIINSNISKLIEVRDQFFSDLNSLNEELQSTVERLEIKE